VINMNKKEIAELNNNDASFASKLEAAVQARLEQIETLQKGIVREAQGVKLLVHDAGEFLDPKTGETVEYEAGIKIKVGKGFIKPSAIQCAFLYRAFLDSEVNTELTKRLKQEQELIKGLFF